MVMRGLRKTAIWLGLIGSVSLLPLAASANDIAINPQADRLEPVATESPAQPSFHDVAIQAAPASQDVAAQAIPPAEPAPVSIEAADVKPVPAIEIPLPDAAPVTALMQADIVR